LGGDWQLKPRPDATIGDFARSAEASRDAAALSLRKAQHKVDLMEEIRRRIGRDDVLLAEALTRSELRQVALAWGYKPRRSATVRGHPAGSGSSRQAGRLAIPPAAPKQEQERNEERPD
jgi:hypothetical protein